MKDKVAYKQPSGVENLRQAMKEVWDMKSPHSFVKKILNSVWS